MKKIIKKVKNGLNDFLYYHSIWELLMLIVLAVIEIIAIVFLILGMLGYDFDSTTTLSTTALSTATTIFNCTRAIHF